MTPADHGYAQCVRCGTQMRPGTFSWVIEQAGFQPKDRVIGRPLCVGEAWCGDEAWCEANRKAPSKAASAIPAPSEGLDRGPYVAHAGSPSTGLDENGDAL
jgi:hypothetical protein